VGIGPGAHGRLTINDNKLATRTHRAPDIWLQQVQEKDTGAHEPECVTPDQRLIECTMMGLRLAEELPWSRLEQESGRLRDSIFSGTKMRSLLEEGYLVANDHGIATTPAGRQRLNALLSYLLN
jgi:oxygen-independent coproporphyrinogen-3 oxidase